MTKYLHHRCDFGPYENAQCSCGKSPFVFAAAKVSYGISLEKKLGVLGATRMNTGVVITVNHDPIVRGPNIVWTDLGETS